MECSGKTKVANFDIAILVNEHIGRLDVSVNYIAAMQKSNSAQEVVNYGYNVVFLNHALGDAGKQLLEIKTKALLHDVDVIELQITVLVIAEWHDSNIVQLHREDVVPDAAQLPHYLYFSQYFFCFVRAVEHILYHLDGIRLAG